MFRFFAPEAPPRLVPALLVALSLVLTSAWAAPAAASDPWLGRDKGLHFAVSLPLAAAGYGLSATLLDPPYQRALSGFSFALLLGVGKEVWDAAGHGQASGRDLLWDGLGAATGVLLAFAIDRLVHHLRHEDRRIAWRRR